MRVLGISPLDKDSTVTIVEDGRILYAAAEERFTRVKLQTGFPWQALQDGLDRTNTQPDDLAVVAYPFLGWEEETRLFERNLQREREFLDDAENAATSAQIRQAASRVPARKGTIPGLREPNEKMEKGFAKTLAYKLLASEGVVSRNVAKRLSDQWGREASTFHRKWHVELEGALEELGLLAKAEAHRTSRQPRGKRLLHERVRRGADRDARRVRQRARGLCRGRPRRTHRACARRRVSALARDVLRVGDVRTRLQAKPARGEDRRPCRLRRSGGPARGAAVAAFIASRARSGSSRATTLYFARMLASEFPKIDVAAAYQHVLEVVATEYVAHYLQQTGLGNLVLSGGVVANVKLNQRLRELPGVQGDLRAPEHGRRRVRHRRGDARVRRQPAR